jgi:exopolysaccharide biosynthesis WecB/TagA/CpsF family protein
VLLVARGNPLQELWIDANLARMNARVAIGVGALFDFLAGRVARAPRWVRRMRMEWGYRLWLEPGRLWRRYLVGNAVFMWRVVRSIPKLDSKGSST